MFTIAPRDEAQGEPHLSVSEAAKIRSKWEQLNALRPNAQNAMNLGCIYFTLGMGKEALTCANTVIEAIAHANGAVSPSVKATAYLNRGMFLRGFGQFGDAQQNLFAAWDLDKSSAYCGMATAEELLRRGNWQDGFKLHNQVRGTCDGAALACGLPHTCTFWDGSVAPAHLLVINEGGAGDRINYTRWLPELTRRGIPWSFFCFDEFKPFYDRLPWIGPGRTISEAEKKEFSPPPSHWTTTFALPGPLGANPAHIPPFETPYLPPKGEFRFEISDGLPIIGLTWSANELFQGGLKVRSLTEGQAMRLICLTAHKVHWVNLQHSHKMPYPVVNVPFETWQDTAELMNACNAVVSVDSGPLWLSLALGKPTAALLTSAEDWKFSSQWPGMKQYHNGPSETLFDAEKAIDALIMDLRNGVWPCR